MNGRNFPILLAVAALIAVAIGWSLGGSGSDITRLSFLSVGQGDCSVFQTEGDAILIDDGPTASTARLNILPKLRQMGIDRVDTIFLSHPDADHVSGTPMIREVYPDAKLAISSEFRTDPKMLKELEAWGIPVDSVEWLPAESTANLGAFSIHIFCPKGKADNDESMMMRIADGNASAEFSGDASATTEQEAIEEGPWRSEVMHAGHHGSRTASSDAWLANVHPAYVVISCGKDNRYGHPHRETLDRIAKEGARLLRTDEDGDVRFVLSGDTFSLESASP